MKEKIQAKIYEVIETILNKKPEDITYNEYRILDSKYASLKWEEEQASKNKEMAELWAKTLGNNIFGGIPAPLPDPEPSCLTKKEE